MKMAVHNMTAELARDCMPVLEANYAESGQFPNDEFSPDMQGFIDSGESFVAFLLFNDEDKIVGLSFFNIGMGTHVNYLLIADQVTFYILPDYRSHTNSFLGFTEKWFTASKIDMIQQGALYNSRFQRLLELKGYAPKDVSMIKRLT